MPVPATDLPAPIAVLVLAWDEATPAVRALVEATQIAAPTVDSILVMVPQADAPDHLSAEEYLPLALPEAEVAAATAAAPAATLPPTAALPPATTEPAAQLDTEQVVAAHVLVEAEAAKDALAESILVPVSVLPASPGPAPATAPVPLAWAAVRVLRLGSQSLPQLAQRAGQPLPAPIWTATSVLPVAPYIGAAPEIERHVALPNTGSTPALLPLATPAQLVPAIPDASPQPAAVVPTPPASPNPPASPLSLSEATEPRPQGADLEADFLVAEANEQVRLETTNAAPVTAEEPTRPLATEQGGWPEALAALRQPAALPETAPAVPAPLPEPAPEPAAATATHPALRPAPAHYPAPDLNFQIIQYARFAVPVALAEPEFAVIYAAAWPTWLAAQELRYRTGRPLVLHVAALAATAAETVETATGWIAELQRQALHRADLILTETPALAQRLRHELGLAFQLVQAIPAADTAAIAQALHAARVRPAG